MRNISKAFYGVSVLRAIDLSLHAGETLVLAGENGAGKSTLMKILGGIYTPDTGEIIVEGESVSMKGPLDAERHGIATIHQELSVIGSMSVVDNLYLGHELSRSGFVSRRAQIDGAHKILQPFGLDLDVTRPMDSFPVAVRQLVEIARATSRNAKIIVMDEPTSSLPDPDVARLIEIMNDMKSRGAGIIFISHKMSEIYEVADRIMVLRDGAHIATAPASEMPQRDLIRNLVGREIQGQIPAPPPLPDDAPEVLAVKDLTVKAPHMPGQFLIKDINFNVRRGEILGFSGLQGSGCSDVFSALFGAFGRRAHGQVSGEIMQSLPRSPREAIVRNLAFLPADRKVNGLVLGLPISYNITLASLEKYSPGGWLRFGAEKKCAASYIDSLSIRCAGPDQQVRLLSGGNQQKVLLARCLETKPSLLLLDEPTRGVDVGAKHEIYELISRIREQGTTIMLITTELPEMLGLADRVCVLHRGKLVRTISRSEATQENILAAAMGEEAPTH